MAEEPPEETGTAALVLVTVKGRSKDRCAVLAEGLRAVICTGFKCASPRTIEARSHGCHIRASCRGWGPFEASKDRARARWGKSRQHAKFDRGNEHQGWRRQVNAGAGACRDDIGLSRQERAGDRQRRPGQRVEHADVGVEPLQAAERRRDHRRLPASAACSRTR